MYNEKIEQLINAALADGVLTEKEKQVLFKRAHDEGIDLDEFEIILDAKLLEAQNAERERRAKAAPKSDKYADVRKCPACGTIIPPNTKVCPGCGMLFSNNESDIREISMLQDNYVKLNKVNALFPSGPIYLSVLVLVTLFNVFAWVYAIACDDLVGLPWLSTIVWIIALIVFFTADEKKFTAFDKQALETMAQHQKLLSTAKAFYAQDKSVIERINKIDEQVSKTVAEKIKTSKTYMCISYGSLVAAITLSLLLSFGWFNNVLIINDYDKCKAAINKAVQANRMDKAESYYMDYGGSRRLARELLHAYIELDDESKVIFYYNEARYPDKWDLDDNGDIVEEIVRYYISKNQPQSAIDALSKYSFWEINHALETCILDYMKKGEKGEAQKLIKTNSYLFNSADSNSEYYKPKVVKALTNLTRE